MIDSPESVQLVLEAKRKREPAELLRRHTRQVLIEQIVTSAPWAILTDGNTWILFDRGHPFLCAKSLEELRAQMPSWKRLAGREALISQSGELPSPVRLLTMGNEPLSGQEPTGVERQGIDAAFPELRRRGYYVLAPPSDRYNSVAAAAGDRGRWWWPSSRSFWPIRLVGSNSLSVFADAYRLLGFEDASDPSLETGLEKIAVFAMDGHPTHAARQVASGLWTSKLGVTYEILHNLYDLEGPHFGELSLVVRKSVP